MKNCLFLLYEIGGMTVCVMTCEACMSKFGAL